MSKAFLIGKKLLAQTKVQICLLILLTVLSYGNSLQNGISYDDKDFLLYWPAIQNSQSGLSSFLSLPDLLAGDLPLHHRGVYRPIRSVYYLISYKLWGFNPFMYHLQSIVVHSLVVITVYGISKIITKKSILSFMAAAFFATHPVHTEAITYTSASFDSLGLLFAFASFYFYLRADSKKAEKETTFLLSWLLAFLAFFTYEITLMLPFLMVFYDFCFKKLTRQTLFSRLKIYMPYLIIIFLYILVRVFFLQIGDRAELGQVYLIASNQAKFSIPHILYLYALLLLFPLKLSVFYNINNPLFMPFIQSMQYIDPSERLLGVLSNISPLIPLTFVAFFFSIFFFLFRKKSLILFCFGWFFISILPVMNLLPQGAIMAERFLYLPSFGYCLLLAWILYSFPQNPWFKIKQKHLILVSTIIFILIISAYSIRTYERNKDWKDEETIFLKAYEIEPNSYMVNGALGTLKFEKGEYEESVKHFEVAVRNNPASYKTRHQLGLAYEKVGQHDKAIKEYLEVLAFDPNYYYAISGLANVYQKQGKYDEAIITYKNAIKVDPSQLDSHFGLAGTYVHKQMYLEAAEEYQLALKIRPNDALSHNGLGYIHEQSGNLKDSISEYRRAIELEPQNPAFHKNLAIALEKANNISEALKEFEKALELQPDSRELKEKINSLKER